MQAVDMLRSHDLWELILGPGELQIYLGIERFLTSASHA